MCPPFFVGATLFVGGNPHSAFYGDKGAVARAACPYGISCKSLRCRTKSIELFLGRLTNLTTVPCREFKVINGCLLVA